MGYLITSQLRNMLMENYRELPVGW